MPSQPPENVRALSITSDVAVISWSEPPRSTLNGVLKGYRVIFWSLYIDGGESAGALAGSRGEGAGGWALHSCPVRAEHLPPKDLGPQPGTKVTFGGRGGCGEETPSAPRRSVLGKDLRGDEGVFAFLMSCVDMRPLWSYPIGSQQGDSWLTSMGQLKTV